MPTFKVTIIDCIWETQVEAPDMVSARNEAEELVGLNASIKSHGEIRVTEAQQQE